MELRRPGHFVEGGKCIERPANVLMNTLVEAHRVRELGLCSQDDQLSEEVWVLGSALPLLLVFLSLLALDLPGGSQETNL